MTIEIPAVLEERVRRSVANGEFESVDACVLKAVDSILPQAPAPLNGESPSGDEPTIGEVIRDLFAQLPPEERRDLPVDGAAEHDHYIYGLPKKGE